MPSTNHHQTSTPSTTATTTSGSLSSVEATSNGTASDTDTFLLNHLHQTSALEDLHANLLSSLQRVGWTERVRNLSLELLRSGKCNRFDDMVEAVVALAEGRSLPVFSDNTTNKNDLHDASHINSRSNGDIRDSESEPFFENIDVRIPPSVVEQGVREIKDALRPIVELEDDGVEGNDIKDHRTENSTMSHKAQKPEKKNLKLSAAGHSGSTSKQLEKVGGLMKSPEKVAKTGDTSKHHTVSNGGGGADGSARKPPKDGPIGKKSQKAGSKN